MSYTNVEQNVKVIIDSVKKTEEGEEQFLKFINQTVDTYNRTKHYFGIPTVPIITLNGIELDFIVIFKKEIEEHIQSNEIVVPLEAVMKHYAH